MGPTGCLVQVGENDGEGCAVPPANPSKRGTMHGRCVQTCPRSPPLLAIRGSLSGGVPLKMSSRATGDFPSGNDPVKPPFLATEKKTPSGDVPVRSTAPAIGGFLLGDAPLTIDLSGGGCYLRHAVLHAVAGRCGSLNHPDRHGLDRYRSRIGSVRGFDLTTEFETLEDFYAGNGSRSQRVAAGAQIPRVDIPLCGRDSRLL